MSVPLQEENIISTLLSSKSRSTAGIDSIPYDLWKLLHKEHKKPSRNEKPSFNVMKTLTHVINDIQIHGMMEDSPFALGWLCPLYKKKGLN
jgi:hypothetical protein